MKLFFFVPLPLLHFKFFFFSVGSLVAPTLKAWVVRVGFPDVVAVSGGAALGRHLQVPLTLDQVRSRGLTGFAYKLLSPTS